MTFAARSFHRRCFGRCASLMLKCSVTRSAMRIKLSSMLAAIVVRTRQVTFGIECSFFMTVLAQSIAGFWSMLKLLSVRSQPPNSDCSSAIITLAPAFAATKAACNPDAPPPATNRSQWAYLCSYLSGS